MHSAQSASKRCRDVVTVHNKNGVVRPQTPIRPQKSSKLLYFI